MRVLKSPQSLILILATINFFSRIAVSLTVRSSYVPISNELEQYHHFKNITNYDEKFFHDIDCKDIKDHYDLKVCLLKEMERAKEQKLFPSTWKRIITEVTVGNDKKMNQQVDCAYKFSTRSVKTNVKDFMFSVYFNIIQSNCISGTKILGGASFYIVANTPDFLSTCGIIDLFNDTYNVECRLPLNTKDKDSFIDPAMSIKYDSIPMNTSSHKNKIATNISSMHRKLDQQSYCMNISIVMEHEHFDAFGREGGFYSAPPMLYHEILKDFPMCTLIGNNDNKEHTKIIETAHTKREVLNSTYVNKMSLNYLYGVWIGEKADKYVYRWRNGDYKSLNSIEINKNDNHNNTNDNHNNNSNNNSDNDSKNYNNDKNGIQFKHDNNFTLPLLSKDDYKKCQDRQTNLFLGESHQRFTWSYLAYHYHQAQQKYLNTLERKHGDIAFFHFNLTQKYMIPHIAHYLDEFLCPLEVTDRIAIALQAGSWDLTASPLRNVMESSKYGAPVLLNAIKRMEARGCSKTVKLVFVQTMPHPKCNKNDGLCENSQLWHNNYATAALNRYYMEALQKPEFFYGNLEVVDSLGIMGANMHQYECMNHFLCRHGEKQSYRVATTPAGEALASEIMSALCD